MSTTSSAPRIAPVDLDELTDAQRAMAGVGASSVVQTLLRRPDLFTPWITLGGALLSQGRLSVRDRELVILRVALRTRCEYEWANHVPAAIAAGVRGEELSTLAEADSPLLRAVDELCAENRVTTATWDALSADLDDETMIELVLVAGYYLMNAGMLNSLGVQKEPGRVGLGEVPAPRPSAPEKPSGPAHGSPFGIWEVTFHHPVQDQRLRIELLADGEKLVGTVTSEEAALSTPIVSGTVRGSRIGYTTTMTQPIELELAWTGAVYGEAIFGEVSISGAAFPFEVSAAERSRAPARLCPWWPRLGSLWCPPVGARIRLPARRNTAGRLGMSHPGPWSSRYVEPSERFSILPISLRGKASR